MSKVINHYKIRVLNHYTTCVNTAQLCGKGFTDYRYSNILIGSRKLIESMRTASIRFHIYHKTEKNDIITQLSNFPLFLICFSGTEKSHVI
jgi:hypothetical protein